MRVQSPPTVRASVCATERPPSFKRSNAFSDAIQQAVELRWILNQLMVALGRPDLNPRPGPVRLPVFTEETFIRPNVTLGWQRLQDFVRGVALIGELISF